VASFIQLQERIAVMMQCGESLDRVEDEVINSSGLESDQRAALWLYAWSFMESKEQRDQATRYLLAVEPG
jgi:hypothetical protein